MTNNKRVILGAIITTSLVVISSLMIINSLNRVQNEVLKQKEANKLVELMSDFMVITEEFIDLKNRRSEEQWEDLYKKIEVLISQDEGEYSFYLDTFKTQYDRFDAIRNNYKEQQILLELDKNSKNIELIELNQIFIERQTTQMRLFSLELLDSAFKKFHASQKNVEIIRKQNYQVIILFLILIIISITIDALGLINLEARQKKTQMLLQSSLESPKGMIIFSIDKNYRYLYFNKAHELGMKYAYNSNVQIGLNALDYISSEEDRQNAKKSFDLAMLGESHTTNQVYGDVEKNYYESLYNPIFDTKGEVLGISVFAQDITARKQSEQALAAEKENLAVTLRSIGDGVITTDTKGNIVMLNKVAEELTGWISNEASGHPLPEIFNIINENTLEPCENPVEKVLTTGGIIELENHTCLIAKDGRKIVIADSGAPIRNKESQIIGVVLVFRDMTEKKKLEDVMQNSQKLESLGILAGGIAHDFNNILGAIFGYTELAIMKTKEEGVSTYLKKSLSNIDRARALTDQLLTFAKGGAPIKKIEQLFPFIQETTQFALSGSSVSVLFQIQDNLWACDFDKNKIGQVFDNLTINALQAMPLGGTIIVSAINISLSQKEHIKLPAGNYVKLSIKDQGIGIQKELLIKIFDPYYTTKPNGHGLGLATCFSIINRHDGYIEVESELEKGSTFHIYLPAAIGPSTTTVSEPKKEHSGDGTFLVMDDEETNREIIQELLESFGYTVVLKENGQDAIDFFKKVSHENRKLSGMIFDLTIPGGMGGKEVIEEIRKICLDTPAFVASGYSGDPVIANPKEYGFTASILKPFMKEELSEMLENNMKKVNS